LQAIFEDPVRADIEWLDVESLLRSLGAELTEGRGSRVRVALTGIKAVFHRPHPEREVGKAAVKSIRAFIEEAGVRVEEDEE
jgi:HicA toxin of bacterial toxin-antitoxin,